MRTLTPPFYRGTPEMQLPLPCPIFRGFESKKHNPELFHSPNVHITFTAIFKPPILSTSREKIPRR